MEAFFQDFIDAFSRTMLLPLWADGPNGFYLLWNGLLTTLFITFFATIIGIVLGTFCAILRIKKVPILSTLAKIYIEVIRGTPALVQLTVIYFIIFASVDISKTLVAIIAFGLNSGAYVTEIIRAGLQSVDKGQDEAARSLGLNSKQSMRLVVLPQAVVNILPALGNEFIVLIKDTSLVGFIGGVDLMRAGEKIRSITYEATIPLLIVAVIYLAVTLTFTLFFTRLEKRMRRHYD